MQDVKSPLKILFSFTLFGDAERYLESLSYYSNIRNIFRAAAEIHIVVFYVEPLPISPIDVPGIDFIRVPKFNNIRTLDRYLGLKFISLAPFDIVSIRDLDSHFTEHEFEIVLGFIKSGKFFMTIRDGLDHPDPIMAGNFYFRPVASGDLQLAFDRVAMRMYAKPKYRSDQIFLSFVYPLISRNLEVYTSTYRYMGEAVFEMPIQSTIIGSDRPRKAFPKWLYRVCSIPLPLIIYRLSGNRNPLHLLTRFF